jgi:hypothetical protein
MHAKARAHALKSTSIARLHALARVPMRTTPHQSKPYSIWLALKRRTPMVDPYVKRRTQSGKRSFTVPSTRHFFSRRAQKCARCAAIFVFTTVAQTPRRHHKASFFKLIAVFGLLFQYVGL